MVQKPVRAIKNQYRGINAHLHSKWQKEGNFNSFHTTHISDLNKALKALLRPMGYTCDVEQSVQIRRIDTDPVEEPQSDVLIYDTDPVRAAQPAYPAAATAAETLVMPLAEIMVYPKPSRLKHYAIAIYERIEGQSSYGKPVAWIELLSPSNKVNSRDTALYQAKREKILRAGIVFVEIDYLHESGTAWDKLPVYRVRKNRPAQPGSHPYYIIVVDPRPYFEQSQATITGFDVDVPIPPIKIPLNGQDVLEFDFNRVYQKTFEEAFYGDEVDYSQLPVNFDRYSEADQARIVSRMVAVLNMAKNGTSLEVEPEEIEILSLERGLERLKAGELLS